MRMQSPSCTYTEITPHLLRRAKVKRVNAPASRPETLAWIFCCYSSLYTAAAAAAAAAAIHRAAIDRAAIDRAAAVYTAAAVDGAAEGTTDRAAADRAADETP